MSSPQSDWDEPRRLLGAVVWHMVNQGLMHPYNIPRPAASEMLRTIVSQNAKKNRLWVVDRILEPQTIAHFLQATVGGVLVSGNKTALPLVDIRDVNLLQTPMKDWAPAPYSAIDSCLIEQMTSCIGTLENERPQVAISKELIAMKARVWEGLSPISEARWQKLGLDKPEKFNEACHYIASVTGVFNYLNTQDIRHRLRDTYNAVWSHLDRFDKALQLADSKRSDSGVSTAALWHEYIKDRYTFIVIQAHNWVISHIKRLERQIVDQLDNGTLESTPEGRKSPQFQLANKFHDLSENTAHAHFNIFLPMHGYYGDVLALQDHVTFTPRTNLFLMEPVEFSLAPRQRREDYCARHKYLSRREWYTGWVDRSCVPSGTRDFTLAQAQAHELAGKEIRGEEEVFPKERWIMYAEESLAHGVGQQWRIIGYRTSLAHSDDEWDQFVAKFDEERQRWGLGLEGIGPMKEQCRVEWVDAKHLVPAGSQDYTPLKRHFNDLAARTEQSKPMKSLCLVGDSSSIESYLNPRRDAEGHVLAIEPNYDPADTGNRFDEEPGYSGWVRIVGDLLWDDLFPLFLLQSQGLGDFWALAEQDADHIYRHPLGPVLYHK